MSQEIIKNNLDKEFLDFFTYCKKQKFNTDEIKIICEPFQKLKIKKFFNYLLIFSIIFILLILGYNFINSISWIISAIGRLFLIKILPFWNWTEYYNAKCLITSLNFGNNQQQNRNKYYGRNTMMLGKYETESNNCWLCEHFGKLKKNK